VIDLTQPWQVITGDCLEVLKQLPDGCVDAVVTDPPYGIKADKRGAHSRTRDRPAWRETNWDSRVCQRAIDECLRVARHAIVFGGNYYQLPPARCWLVWDKKQPDTFSMSHAELAWTNLPRSVRMWRGRPVTQTHHQKLHPTQKPLPLMEWCLSFLPDGCTVLDPFCGSGTTGVACQITGRKFLGIEIDPTYADIARRRIAEAVPLGATA
jgi:DNA modification methylase